MKSSSTTSLKHHFLIAMPHMADPNFAHTLIYLVEHNEQGAMGLIVNQPSDMTLADVLQQLSPEAPPPTLSQSLPILRGGPVQTDRGFILHSAGPRYQATLELDELALSTSQDTLFAIASGNGPDKYLITLGYSGWDGGQLESELLDNAWLTCPASCEILFDLPHQQRLHAAAAQLGVSNLGLLICQSGHA